MRDNIYWQLFLVFVPLSLVSLGGAQSIITDVDKQVVELHGWITQADFVDLFAISRAAPGPGSLLVTLLGWKVAGWTGALAASAALFLPSSLLAFVATRLWNRHRGRAWHNLLAEGLAPIATGLILSSAFTILRSSSGMWSLWLIAGGAAAIFLIKPRLSPIPIFLAAGGAQIAFQALT